MQKLIHLANSLTALEKEAARKPKQGEIYQDSNDIWMIIPKRYPYDPVPFDRFLSRAGNPGINSDDTVDLWYFRDIPPDHAYWTFLEEQEGQEPGTGWRPDGTSGLDYGRYFPTKREAISDAGKWMTSKLVGLKKIPVDRLKIDGKYKRSVVFKATGGYSRGDPGTDVTPGKLTYVEGKGEFYKGKFRG